MDIGLVLLRIVHIFAGVFWVGGGVLTFGYIEPAVKATAPESQKFMQYLLVQRRFSFAMGLASLLTVAAGALLYWRDSGGFQWSWITSAPGLGFSLGALVGIAVFFIGLLVIKPTAERLSALGQQIASAGQPPSIEQLAEMKRLQAKMSTISRWDFILLTIALLAMATARYW
jgi:uncharacterized membrane protein